MTPPRSIPLSECHLAREKIDASLVEAGSAIQRRDEMNLAAGRGNAGFSGQVVKDLGGWKSEAMMRRYAALTSATLREAAEASCGERS